jgi:hypothetical protein
MPRSAAARPPTPAAVADGSRGRVSRLSLPRCKLYASAVIIAVLLWSSAADAGCRHYSGRYCGPWSACYVHALSREHMSGMVTRFSGSYWTTRR